MTRTMRSVHARSAAAAATLCLLWTAASACEREQRLSADRPLARPVAPTSVRTSDLLAGPLRAQIQIRNPYEGDPHAVSEGRRMYTWMNCAGCHGPAGGGGIGPPFVDSDWIYGSSAQNVYQSIVQGRPNGMPAFDALSDDVVWKIAAHVRSLDPAIAEERPDVEDATEDAVRAREIPKDESSG